MSFRIADTFTESLARLTGAEQTAAKTAAFDLQTNPTNPGLQFHRLDKTKDKNFWSVRVNQDIRVIIHRTDSSVLLCYVDHHDKAYKWAERRKLEVHPTTGAAQLVEIRETVKEIFVPKYVEVQQPVKKKAVLAHLTDEQLLRYGVPEEWIRDVKLATDDTILEIAEHLPAEAAEAILDLATGRTLAAPEPISKTPNPFEHPDAQRRFRLIDNLDELKQALEFPWEKWTIFLHPAQRSWVERSYNGPARVSGSAGTGKTIVALHRGVFLARNNPDARVLITTFSDTLANALRAKLRQLISGEPRLVERIEIHSMNAIARRLYELHFGKPRLAEKPTITKLLAEATSNLDDPKLSASFLQAEWQEIVDTWELKTWEAYRDVARLGRKTRLPEVQREKLWSIFQRVKNSLEVAGEITNAEMFGRLADHFSNRPNPPFDFVVVDEAQDISPPQLRFLASFAGTRPDGLFFAGDMGQRIFQQPFSWKSLGVDVRGRSRTLRVNYRTSHQIRTQADKLLGPNVADVDGNVEERAGTLSVFNGPLPDIVNLVSEDEEIEKVAFWLSARKAEGARPHEIAVFVRSESEIARATAAVEKSGMHFKVLDDYVETTFGHVCVSTMHLAKGLEFKAVAVMACDDEIIPSQERIEQVTDESDLREVYDTERHLLYVACTRARDRLIVTSAAFPSEFIEDLSVA
jgi:mRNA-degrading endonuclease RelE of RelBE toxin-antitoxin system